MLTSNLACGPMSGEIIESVFRHSHKFAVQLMLICSRNQVDSESGYVFTTKKYMNYIAQMRRKYFLSDVIICRDHCGPGFGSPDNSIESVKSTIRCDIENGFDLIHIDLCHAITQWDTNPLAFGHTMSHKERMRNTTELMRFAVDINPNIMFEIGTDENTGRPETDIDRIVTDIRTCQDVANPIFYVVQTGSLVRENFQAGSFNADKVKAIHEALRNCGTKFKEHNADYLSKEQLSKRKGIVDAVNIASQLGVVQTNSVLSKALLYGIDIQSFSDEVCRGEKWSKWTDDSYNNRLCTLIAGHYHFNGPSYEELIGKLSKKMNIKEYVVGEITTVIEHYLFSMESQ